MTKSHLCNCGNCTETICPVMVSISRGDQRPRFCSELHAAIWLIDQASHHHQPDYDKHSAIMATQEIFQPLKRKTA